MRSTFRSCTFGLAATLAGAAMAQQPSFWSITGTITGCSPSQTVEVTITNQNNIILTASMVVDPGTCTFGDVFNIPFADVSMIATTQCNGMILTDSDSTMFNFIGDTAYSTINWICGNSNAYDCNNVLNGPNMPGTPCDDSNPMTTEDVWSSACICVGTDNDSTDCLGMLGGSAWPGTPCVDFFGTAGTWSPGCVCVPDSGGMDPDCLGNPGGDAQPGSFCIWNNQPGTWSTDCVCTPDSGGVYDCLSVLNGPNMPGTYCINFFGDTGVWTVQCICQTNTNVYDCLGELNGPNMPGTVCDDGDPMTVQDHWDANCDCIGTQANNYDCLGVLGGNAIPGTVCEGINSDSTGFVGIWDYFCVCQADSNNTGYDCVGNPGGGALPGTPCTYTPDNGNTWITSIWSPDCVCGPDSGGFIMDCLGVWGGSALPGAACTVPGTILEGTWSSACVCVANNPEPCEADFWVIQAMGPDSLPVPYELWVWNLSSGGSGNFQFLWNFGDGTSSTDAFPTHTYSGNGPYVLCLTISDNNNCTSTHCDSVSINGDGIYEGMVVHAEDRQDGFTINVQNPSANAVQEVVANNSIATWPNPAVDELNVAVVSGMKGLVTVTITDLDGRTVKAERASLGGGRSQLRIATSGLNAGMYMLRITDGSVNLSQHFVKTN